MARTLFLYNTASRSKERFEPLNDPVGMYCCGPTVYNCAHIGNLRTYIFEDVLKRVLLALGYRVKHVVNITDVGHLTSDQDTGEDKMEKGALREGKSVWDIAARFTKLFKDDIAALNIVSADLWPRATDHIDRMIDLVARLEKLGYTYRTSDGIYFDTARFPDYVKFAALDPENLRAGERVEMGEKRSVTDFALWKFSPTTEKRQMEWESPWGIGFPGWHIECSAMSLAYLPQPIDIHCGGADHIRVHHTNEIAQSEAATGKQFVRYWLHGEFLTLDKGKMAKSGGSFVTLGTVRERGIAPLAYRMFCFSAHYRTPLSFSWEGLDAAAQSLANLRRTIAQLCDAQDALDQEVAEGSVADTLEAVYAAVCDDLNMPRALAALWDIVRDGSKSAALRVCCAKRADEIFGLDLMAGNSETVSVVREIGGFVMRFESSVEIPGAVADRIALLLEERRTARKGRDFARADDIRRKLADEGVEVKDLPDGTTTVIVPASVCG